MKIDVFTHVMPKRYKQALYKYADRFSTEKAVQDKRPTLTDNEGRLGKLDGYEDLVQILSAAMPPVEEIVGPEEASELAHICNDEMAEMVARNPKRYLAAIANLPLNNMDAALKETERAIKELKELKELLEKAKKVPVKVEISEPVEETEKPKKSKRK